MSELVEKLKKEAADMKRRANRNIACMEAVHQRQTAAHLLIGASICGALEKLADILEYRL